MGEKTIFEVRTESCQRCKFVDTLNNLTICRRYPPAVVFAPMVDQRTQQVQFASNSAFTQVTALRDWCGEFRPKTAEEN